MAGDLPARVLHLEQNVASVREQIAQLSAEQRHAAQTLNRVDQRTATMCARMDDMPSITHALKDPRVITLLFVLLSGAVGADTVLGSLMHAPPVATAAVTTP